jgi:hypothetical protein
VLDVSYLDFEVLHAFVRFSFSFSRFIYNAIASVHTDPNEC